MQTKTIYFRKQCSKRLFWNVSCVQWAMRFSKHEKTQDPSTIHPRTVKSVPWITSMSGTALMNPFPSGVLVDFVAEEDVSKLEAKVILDQY